MCERSGDPGAPASERPPSREARSGETSPKPTAEAGVGGSAGAKPPGMKYGETPFQTVGPFFGFALVYADGGTLADAGTSGTRISIEGQVFDGAGAPVPDAIVEIWQANAAGRYHHPDDTGSAPLDPPFDGFGRLPTDANGRFVFETIKPGPVPAPDGRLQAPHILVSILCRGLLTRLVTRMYFDDDPAIADDPMLQLVPAARRPTLLAKSEGGHRYRFDIKVQGADETVFFDI